jgi:hypothetical protein
MKDQKLDAQILGVKKGAIKHLFIFSAELTSYPMHRNAS